MKPGTREWNTLGDGFAYTDQPPGEERLCFTNGEVPATTARSSPP